MSNSRTPKHSIELQKLLRVLHFDFLNWIDQQRKTRPLRSIMEESGFCEKYYYMAKKRHSVFRVIDGKRKLKFNLKAKFSTIKLKDIEKALLKKKENRNKSKNSSFLMKYQTDPAFRRKTLDKAKAYKDSAWFKEMEKRRLEKMKSNKYKDKKTLYDFNNYYGPEWGHVKYLEHCLKKEINGETL